VPQAREVQIRGTRMQRHTWQVSHGAELRPALAHVLCTLLFPACSTPGVRWKSSFTKDGSGEGPPPGIFSM
jgi:hypothetical protein